MKIPRKSFDFIPASTRIVLSRLGREASVRIPPGLPVIEIEEEIEWHEDLLRWYAREVAGRAFLMPSSHLDAFFATAMDELYFSSNFTSAEVAAIVRLAKTAVHAIHDSPFSREVWGDYQEELARDWKRLGIRFTRFEEEKRTK